MSPEIPPSSTGQQNALSAELLSRAELLCTQLFELKGLKLLAVTSPAPAPSGTTIPVPSCGVIVTYEGELSFREKYRIKLLVEFVIKEFRARFDEGEKYTFLRREISNLLQRTRVQLEAGSIDYKSYFDLIHLYGRHALLRGPSTLTNSGIDDFTLKTAAKRLEGAPQFCVPIQQGEMLGFRAHDLSLVIITDAVMDDITKEMLFMKLWWLAKEDESQKVIGHLRRIDQLKEEILSNTSHELRTPLHGIVGLSETLLEGSRGELTGGIREDLQMILSSSRRLVSLVNDILDFSRMRKQDITLRPKPVSIHGIATLVMALSKPLVSRKKVALRNDVRAELPAVLADEDRLQQILHNLVGNAIKFTHEGHVRLSAESYDGHLQLKVEDTGIGIPARHLDSIFQPFEQGDSSTERQYGGTGLGLPISKRLIELQNGSITVHSVQGEGSCFTITLPTTDAAPEGANPAGLQRILFEEAQDLDPPPAASDATSNQRALRRILIVDDEPVNLKVLERQLSLEGYAVESLQNSTEVISWLKAAQTKGELPDLALLDVMMPHLSGLDLCSQIRDCFTATELPIIFLTAKNQVTDLVTGFSLGANDYLTKPFSRAELAARLSSHLLLRKLNQEVVTHKEMAASAEKEREAVQVVQSSLLPAAKTGGLSFASYYSPAARAGGDWYYHWEDRQRRREYFLIADVTGHGIPSAMLTGVLNGGFLASMRHLQGIDHAPEEVLRELLKSLNEIVLASRNAKLCATMAALCIEIDTGLLTYANAAHVPVEIITPQQMKSLCIPGELLGLHPSPHFECRKVALAPGDTVLAMTDGVLENHGPSGESVKKRHLRSTLLGTSGKSLEQMRDDIVALLGDRWGAEPPEDDTTFFLVRWDPNAAEAGTRHDPVQ